MKSKGTLKRIFSYIGRYKLLLPLSLLFAAVTVAFTLYIPILVGEAIDLIAYGNTDFSKIAEKFTLAAVLIGVGALLQWLMSTINNRIAYNVLRDVRNDAFTKLERLPLSYLDRKKSGETVNRIINDADQFSEGLLLGFTQLFTGILTIIGTLAFMIYLNWLIALVVVVLTPMSLLVAKFIAKRTYSMFRLRSEKEARASGYIDEIIGNQKLVKAFSHEDEATEKFNEINEELRSASLNAIFFSSLTNPTTRFVNSVVYAAVALFGALAALGSLGTVGGVLLTVGELTCLLSYANQYTKPFNEISGVLTEFQNSLACASRVFELIDEETEPADKPDALSLGEAKGNIDLEDVSFSYTPDKPLIKNISLSVKEGQRVAIVGPTGCGKTTLINLLMRFYDVNGGGIKLDGCDLRDITRTSLRTNYGMVLQDTWIMAGTIKENIAIAKPDATDEEIIKAAKKAHAHGFIKRLKNGYDTVIGESGEGLSQGQKQLLCIARIMLTEPPILILDEATSSIDTRTEMKIQDAFSEIMRGRTSFIVAHRLSTVKEADIILVMKDGDIIETGSHEELIERKGFYFDLYNSQFAH